MKHPFLYVLQMSLSDVCMQQQKGNPMLLSRVLVCQVHQVHQVYLFAWNWNFTAPMERR